MRLLRISRIMSDTVGAAAPRSTFNVNHTSTGSVARRRLRDASTILCLDFGSQTSHLILQRIRALNVRCEMLGSATKLVDLTWKPAGIILSGGLDAMNFRSMIQGLSLTTQLGPSSVYSEEAPRKPIISLALRSLSQS